jgi:anti-anti-sigma factor
LAERRLFVNGDIDLANAATLQDRLLVLMQATDDDLVLDCKYVRFIDQTGIAVFAHTHRLLEVLGRRFRVTNLGGLARRPFEALGLTEALSIEPEPEPA